MGPVNKKADDRETTQTGRPKPMSKKRLYPSYNLFNIGWMKNAFKTRPFQFILQLPVAAVFVLIVVTGFYGVPDPGKNFATIAVWTFWWSGIIFLILFFGASWCLVCPWAAMADWVERLSLWKKTSGLSLGYKWPAALKNRNIATVFFISVTWIELGAFITYSPALTAYLASTMLFLAAIAGLCFERKVFCRYVCFVGGIIGMYSNLAPLEVRSKNRMVCGECKTKECVKGSDNGYGCPIFEYPGGMDSNSNCIICSECFKTCPSDNMSLRVRPFLTDIAKGYEGRYDSAALALTLLALTLFHGFTMTPVWTGWAAKTINISYYTYISVFTIAEAGFILTVAQVHYIMCRIVKTLRGARGVTLKRIFIRYSYALLPIAFFYHISHNLDHFNMEGLTIIPALSDPFGWGWDIFGTVDWRIPAIVGIIAIKIIEVTLIIVGFTASLFLSYTTSTQLFPARGSVLKATALFTLVALVYALLSIAIAVQPMPMRTTNNPVSSFRPGSQCIQLTQKPTSLLVFG